MSEQSFEGFRDKIIFGLSVYPLIIGLYAAGFFWDLPKDIIGAFDLTEFIFKASIIYALMIAASLFPLLFLVLLTAPFHGEGKSRRSEREDFEEDSWGNMTLRRKIRFSLAGLSTIIFFVYVAFEHAPSLRFSPGGFLSAFVVVYVFGPVFRPFIGFEEYRLGKIVLAAIFVILIPVLAGNVDSEPSKEGPYVQVNDENCPVIFVGTESVIAKCASGTALAERAKDKQLFWPDRN